MAMKGCSGFPKVPASLSLTIRLFSVISRKLVRESNPSVEKQSVYSTAPADWGKIQLRLVSDQLPKVRFHLYKKQALKLSTQRCRIDKIFLQLVYMKDSVLRVLWVPATSSKRGIVQSLKCICKEMLSQVWQFLKLPRWEFSSFMVFHIRQIWLCFIAHQPLLVINAKSILYI